MFLLGFTLQIALAGWAALAILERYTRHARRRAGQPPPSPVRKERAAAAFADG